MEDGKRKAISVTCAYLQGDRYNAEIIIWTAVCDDGTIWVATGNQNVKPSHWERLPDIPEF